VTECQVLQVARARVVLGARGGVGLGTRQARHRVAQCAGAGRQSDLGELGGRLRGGSEDAPAVRALAGILGAGRGRSWRDAGWLRGLAKALGPAADRGGRGGDWGGCSGWGRGGWSAWDLCAGRGSRRLKLGPPCARRRRPLGGRCGRSLGGCRSGSLGGGRGRAFGGFRSGRGRRRAGWRSGGILGRRGSRSRTLVAAPVRTVAGQRAEDV
jgi:hypothetical protein